MGRRLVSLLIVFALLFGVSGGTALAHAHDAAPSHAAEMLDIHAQPDAGDAKANLGHHHHGVSDAMIAANDGAPVRLATGAGSVPSIEAALRSVKRQPPTEPPSA